MQSAQLCAGRRGKKDQKHYMVLVADVTAEDQASFQPQLNDEHGEWRWWSWSDLTADKAPPLHPVVEKLLKEPLRKELAAMLPLWGAGPEEGRRPEKVGAGLLMV